MYWKNCMSEPPEKDKEYVVLILDHYNPRWLQTDGKYLGNNIWEIWLDGYGWSSDSGETPLYYFELPPEPPLPSTEPLCDGFCFNYCLYQKNIPRCFCRGDKKKCECEESFNGQL